VAPPGSKPCNECVRKGVDVLNALPPAKFPLFLGEGHSILFSPPWLYKAPHAPPHPTVQKKQPEKRYIATSTVQVYPTRRSEKNLPPIIEPEFVNILKCNLAVIVRVQGFSLIVMIFLMIKHLIMGIWTTFQVC
jgi:hypothetical protein